MIFDPEYSLKRKKEQISKIEIQISCDPASNTVRIGTSDGFYVIVVKLSANASRNMLRIERRAQEVSDFVKGYFMKQPEELHKLGYPLQVAMVNSVGTAVAFNIAYVAKGTGDIQIPAIDE